MDNQKAKIVTALTGDTPYERLKNLMTRLRNECPWDSQQTFESISKYTIEEAYEVADAIQQGDKQALKEELGDLLFQVVFHAQMASERGLFDFNDVASGIHQKMVQRHPHVFDADKRTLLVDQETVILEPKAAALLAYFCQNPNKHISRDELIEQVWHGQIVSDNAINRVVVVFPFVPVMPMVLALVYFNPNSISETTATPFFLSD